MPIYRKDSEALDRSASSLADLILGNQVKKEQDELGAMLKGEAAAKNRADADAFAKAQGLKPGKYSMNVSDSGYSVNPEPAKDPLELLLRAKQLDFMREERDDKKVQELSKRVEGAQIGPSQSALQSLGTSVNQNGVALGPVSSALPAWMVSAGEQLGLANKGAT
jgi:hypothetical protein